MRIAVDVMGGDHAPGEIVAGCIAALELPGFALRDDASAADASSKDQMVLIGDEVAIRRELGDYADDPRIQIRATTEVIGMADSPVESIRAKPDSSIAVMGAIGGRKAGDARCDVVISAGNTGACVAAAQMNMRRLPGVHRPGIAVTMPTFHGPVVVCDVGANPEPKPSHLFQYGHMAGLVAKHMHGIDNPRVALMSIGGEEGKGNTLTRETHKLLKADGEAGGINYIGYVEGRDVFAGKADVIVTEGFTGNVVLKLSEGLAAGLFKTIGREIMMQAPELAEKFEPVVKAIYKRHDYNETGGAPLLGVNGQCVICHGSSKARTITNAISMAGKREAVHLNDLITAELKRANKIYDIVKDLEEDDDEDSEPQRRSE